MRSVVCLGTLVAAAVVAAACSDSSGPRVVYPVIGGTYTGNITYELNEGGAPFVVNPGISIQMSDPDGNGVFSGSFAFNSGGTGIGEILGQFSTDGSTITWQQFGDVNQPPFFVGTFLATQFPNCAFIGNVTTFTLDQGGGFGVDGSLNLSGTYNTIHCATDNAGDSVFNASMNVSLTSLNPTPVQRPTGMPHAMSVLKKGFEHVNAH
jgi:hypothetical protein